MVHNSLVLHPIFENLDDLEMRHPYLSNSTRIKSIKFLERFHIVVQIWKLISHEDQCTGAHYVCPALLAHTMRAPVNSSHKIYIYIYIYIMRSLPFQISKKKEGDFGVLGTFSLGSSLSIFTIILSQTHTSKSLILSSSIHQKVVSLLPFPPHWPSFLGFKV